MRKPSPPQVPPEVLGAAGAHQQILTSATTRLMALSSSGGTSGAYAEALTQDMHIKARTLGGVISGLSLHEAGGILLWGFLLHASVATTSPSTSSTPFLSFPSFLLLVYYLNLTVSETGHSNHIWHAPASASGSFDGEYTCAPACVAAVGVPVPPLRGNLVFSRFLLV